MCHARHACAATALCLFAVTATFTSGGCMSPYHSDQGALFGGLGGAGLGAVVGNALGNTAAGAIIGAGAGTLAGAAVGSGMDNIEAKNRAMIESRLGRALPSGNVTTSDVIAMSQAQVEPEVIAEHIRLNGMVAPPTAADLIYLKEQGVSPAVVRAMQTPPARPAAYNAPPGPAVIERHYYGDPYPPYYYYGASYCHPRPAVGWGFSVSNAGCW